MTVSETSMRQLQGLLEQRGADPAYAPLLDLVREPCRFSGQSLSDTLPCPGCGAGYPVLASSHTFLSKAGHWNQEPEGALAGALLWQLFEMSRVKAPEFAWAFRLACDYSKDGYFAVEEPDHCMMVMLIDRLSKGEEKP